MRSGIGPARVLSELGVPVRADLPVGRSLSDHVMTGVTLPLRHEFRSDPEARHVNCCVRYSSRLDGLENDMVLYSVNRDSLTVSAAGSAGGAGSLYAWVNRAYSRGSVEITSTDPHRPPRVRHNLLSDERDLRRLRDGVRLVVELAASEAVAEISESDVRSANEDLFRALDASDPHLDEYLVARSTDTAHGTSTCRMGPATDPAAVVDPTGRVLATDNLWVVDASILPHSPRANTHLVTVMLGEMLADRFRTVAW
jgi:choline dehydrogenase-like flavoprotein